MEGLRSFFNNAKERVDSKMLGSQNYTVERNISSENQSKEYRRKKSQIQNKSSHVEPKDSTGMKVVDSMDYTNLNPKYPFMNESKAFLDPKDVKPKITKDWRSMQHSAVTYGISTSQSVGDVPAHTFIQVRENVECYKEVINLECCGVLPELGYCEVSSVTNCEEDPEISFVKETSGMINDISLASPCSCSRNESSSPATIGLRSPSSPDQLTKTHISNLRFRKSPLEAHSSIVVTPLKTTRDTCSLTLDAESSFNMSVNSQAVKSRKCTSSPVIDLEDENSDAPSTRPLDHTSLTRRIEFGFGSTEPRSQNYSTYAFPEVNQKVQIYCSLCRSPLGHPENHSYLNCLLTSSSKEYLLSLVKKTSGTATEETLTSVSIIMTDFALVNQRLCRSCEGSKGQGIWCEQDGCVFNTIFCPFCTVSNTFLGVQVMATNSSNVQFLSKILFFADHVDVANNASSMETTSKHKEPLAGAGAAVERDLHTPQSSSKIQEAGGLQNQSCAYENRICPRTRRPRKRTLSCIKTEQPAPRFHKPIGT